MKHIQKLGRQVSRLDKACGNMNIYLFVTAIGLACLYGAAWGAVRVSHLQPATTTGMVETAANLPYVQQSY